MFSPYLSFYYASSLVCLVFILLKNVLAPKLLTKWLNSRKCPSEDTLDRTNYWVTFSEFYRYCSLSSGIECCLRDISSQPYRILFAFLITGSIFFFLNWWSTAAFTSCVRWFCLNFSEIQCALVNLQIHLFSPSVLLYFHLR